MDGWNQWPNLYVYVNVGRGPEKPIEIPEHALDKMIHGELISKKST